MNDPRNGPLAHRTVDEGATRLITKLVVKAVKT